MANVFKRAADKLHELIYKPRNRYLSPEEAQQVAQNVQKSVIRMNENLAWAQIQAQAEIEMIRMLPKGDPRIPQHRRKLKLKLVMQQYMEKMATSMEMVNSQIELSQMSAEMGQALTGATQLVNTYRRDVPSFTGFVRDFMKSIGPMNEALNGGLDEMTRALDEMCDGTLESVYSEAELDAMIYGTPVEAAPAEAAPEAEPAAQPMGAPAEAKKPGDFDDLLSSIEKELGNWKKDNA